MEISIIKKRTLCSYEVCEMLDEKKFDKSTKIFDSTDGNFAFSVKSQLIIEKEW